MFQLAPFMISMCLHQLYGSCADERCTLIHLITEMTSQFLEQRISIKFCEMKHGAFNIIPNVSNKVCNGNSQHPHKPRNLTCWNHKWRQWLWLSL